MKKYLLSLFLVCTCFMLSAQNDSIVPPSDDEEDYSMYDNLDFADGAAKRFCTSKVFDLSPAKLISVGFDFQGPFSLETDSFPALGDRSALPGSRSNYNGAGGLRLGANIPVISKNNIIVQLGANYWQTVYYEEEQSPVDIFENPINQTLRANGLKTMGLNSTIFKPFNEKYFSIVQLSGDLNGDFTFSTLPGLERTRFSFAGIFGWKKNDRKMIGFGLSRTFRGGELLYIPVVLLNWTAPNRKWGAEVLAPARAHIRRTFSSRSLAMFGYELEGNSFFLNNGVNLNADGRAIELRRSELRIRGVYERSLKNFIWVSVQAGLRYNFAFEVDNIESGNDFFRGFFGEQPYFMENKLSNTFYTMVSINLVSP